MDEAVDLELRQERDALREGLGRIGVWSFALDALTAEEERDAVREIESLGVGAIWIPEAVESKEIFSHASWIASSTDRAIVASGIASIWARDAVAMTNGWRMLTDAYPERFLLGMGVSHAPSVARRGSTYDKPVAAMRAYLDAMDLAPSSAPEPDAYPRHLLAALGPKMLELAAERSLGAHPYFVPVEHTAFARRRLGTDAVLAVEQAVVLETDASKARRIARSHAVGYLQSANYANNLKRMGWTDSDVAGQGSDAVIDAIVAWGDVDTIASRVRQHLDAGADHVCIQLIAEDEADVGLGQLREIVPALLAL
jgi:probable F420-dependent oxidoreductase